MAMTSEEKRLKKNEYLRKWRASKPKQPTKPKLSKEESLEKKRLYQIAYRELNGRKRTPKPKRYFNEIDMYKEMVVSKNMGIISPKLFEGFQLIIKNISRKFRYDYHQDREDCESYAMENLLNRYHNFDEERFQKVMPYLSECVKRAFAFQYNIIMKSRINTVLFSNLFTDDSEINI